MPDSRKSPLPDDASFEQLSATSPQEERVEPLRVEQVRWFYKGTADAKPLIPFRGYESIAIEYEWRKQRNIPVTSNIEKLNELFGSSSDTIVLDGLYRVAFQPFLEDTQTDVSVMSNDGSTRDSDSGSATSTTAPAVDLHAIKAPLEIGRIEPVYWSGPTYPIVRGTWFLAETPTFYQPVPFSADELEDTHLKHFSGHRLIYGNTALFGRGTAPTLVELKVEGHGDIVWNSVIDINFLYSHGITKLWRRSSQRLYRGYSAAACVTDRPEPIKHVCFVVHGIGQKYLGSSVIVEQTDNLRALMNEQHAKYFSGQGRCILLPVQWRNNLSGLEKCQIELITPVHVESVRQLLNSTVMDIMYYTSPIYRTEVVNGLITELNRLYALFTTHYPTFVGEGGKASIIAHSLGSVVTYDIASQWSPLELYDKYVSDRMRDVMMMEAADHVKEMWTQLEAIKQELRVKEGAVHDIIARTQPHLNFPVENQFSLGSPLGTFLALRGFTRYKLPSHRACKRLYNIYHPCDPIAYRLEPLVHENYARVKPIKIFSCVDRSPKRAYDFQRLDIGEPIPSQSSSAVNDLVKTKETAVIDISAKASSSATLNGKIGSIPELAQDASMSGLETAADKRPASVSPGATRKRVDSKSDAIGIDSTVAESSATSWFWSRFRTASTSSAAKTPVEQADEAMDSDVDASPAKHGKAAVNNSSDDSNSSADQSEESEVISNEAGIPTKYLLDNRVDFTIRQGRFESSYLMALYSHMTYWTHPDVSLFILMMLFPNEEQRKLYERQANATKTFKDTF